NVIDRGVHLTLPDIEAGWSAYQPPGGGWCVAFTFSLRGRRQTAEWEIDVAARELTARNKLASDIGFREAGKKLPRPAPARPSKAAAKKAPAKPTTPPAAVASGDEGVQTLPGADASQAEPTLPIGGFVAKAGAEK